MNEERLMRVLVAPIVSEKSTRVAEEHKQFAFRVLRDARKPEIKRAVELMFGVEVDSVRTANIHGKRKAFQRKMGKRPDFKKAYVKLKPGFDIDFLEVP